MSRTRHRQALVSCLALSCLSTPVRADDLGALKAQLADLERRVDRLAVPETAPQRRSDLSWISFRRGSQATAEWQVDDPGDMMPVDSGFTIAIGPSRDLPAPDHQVTFAGFVKGDVIYDFNQFVGDQFNYTSIINIENQDHVRLHAKQSRFDLKSISQTALGEVRTVIQGDFQTSDSSFRLRYAWGEWSVTPDWTLAAGQFNRNYRSQFNGTPEVDNKPQAGLVDLERNAQVRVTYKTDRSEFAVSIEDPTADTGDLAVGSGATSSTGYRTGSQTVPAGASDALPDLSARWTYGREHETQYLLSGMVRNFYVDGARNPGREDWSALGWGIKGSTYIKLNQTIGLFGSVQYGQGLGNYLVGSNFGAFVDPVTGKIETVEQLGLFAGIGLAIREDTQFNLGWGYDYQNKNDLFASGITDASLTVMAVHANVMWNPVTSLQMGWELIWGQRQRTISVAPNLLGSQTNDDVRAQFGTWFFF